jgi:HEAT repeat protein
MTELVAALQAASAAERWRALAKLNQLKSKFVDAETMSMLLKALADEHPFVRWQAGLALAQQEQGYQKLTETLAVGPVPGSLPQANLVRLAAIDALGFSKTPTADASLIEMLHADDPLIRQSAAEALANKRVSAAVPSLIQALKDPDPWVRRAAAYALGHIGHQEAIPTLTMALQDRAVIVRRSAAYALGALRAQTALPQLKISLGDKDPVTRRNAAWALGRLGLVEAVPALTKLLNDLALNGAIIATARQAIETITRPRWLQLFIGIRGRIRPLK